jgi:hypothetical protein
VKHRRIAVSFSGGRSSAVMTKMVIDRYRSTHDVCVIFANTGAEHPATLDFVDAADRAWEFGVHWIEAVINPEHGIGPRARRVDYHTASRSGEPFRAYVAKHGVPHAGMPQCTSRLKLDPMRHYIRHVIGWSPGTYRTAVGIRADEMDRVSAAAMAEGVWYPLVDAGIGKEEVGAIMAREPWDLALPGDHYGNCVTCWKKSDRKLFTIARDDPTWFDLFAALERDHSEHKALEGAPRRFYRRNRSTMDVLREASEYTGALYSDSTQRTLWDEGLDIGSGCGESCEIYSDGD